MKKAKLLSLLLLIIGPLSYAQQLNAFFSYNSFNSPESGPYVETYLSVIGNSLSYKLNENGKFQGSIEVTLIFKAGETVANFKKYNLLSPELDDTTGSFVNFVDQQRFVLENNKSYDFEIQISDNYTSDEPFISQQSIEIAYPTQETAFSGIELVESFEKTEQETMLTKSGYNIVPYVSSFYPEKMDDLRFYAEIYNSNLELGENEKYLINYFIESYESGNMISKYRRFIKHETSPVNVILGQFNISELASGNYYLVVEARNKSNELICIKKVFFQRSNPSVQISLDDISTLQVQSTFVDRLANEDTLDNFIESVYPISTELERNFVRLQLQENQKLELKQKFFLSFWLNRDRLNPEQAWISYQKELIKVNYNYKTPIKEGFEADRGRVYLQYGPPNTIIPRRNEPNSYPYEIWHYYKTERRSNIKFVFAALDEASNDYVLIHSNAYGEINNYRWQYDLQKRSTPNTNLDDPGRTDDWGNNAYDFFTNPR